MDSNLPMLKALTFNFYFVLFLHFFPDRPLDPVVCKFFLAVDSLWNQQMLKANLGLRNHVNNQPKRIDNFQQELIPTRIDSHNVPTRFSVSHLYVNDTENERVVFRTSQLV